MVIFMVYSHDSLKIMVIDGLMIVLILRIFIDDVILKDQINAIDFHHFEVPFFLEIP